MILKKVSASKTFPLENIVWGTGKKDFKFCENIAKKDTKSDAKKSERVRS